MTNAPLYSELLNRLSTSKLPGDKHDQPVARGDELRISYGGEGDAASKSAATFAACYGFVPDDLADAGAIALRRALGHDQSAGARAQT